MQDYLNKIIELIEPNSRVLDLGCGNGDLLLKLKKIRKVSGYGIDIDYAHIISCIKKGLAVFHGNIEEGLPEFANQSYDYVILSQTLQQVKDPYFLISEIVRVGKKAIVSFPNFAHWKVRFQLLMGHTPKTRTLSFDWYNTPNIRVLNFNDFKELCKKEKIKILQEIPVYEYKLTNLISMPIFNNFLAEKGLFVIQKISK